MWNDAKASQCNYEKRLVVRSKENVNYCRNLKFPTSLYPVHLTTSITVTQCLLFCLRKWFSRRKRNFYHFVTREKLFTKFPNNRRSRPAPGRDIAISVDRIRNVDHFSVLSKGGLNFGKGIDYTQTVSKLKSSRSRSPARATFQQ